MRRARGRFENVNWSGVCKDGHTVFTKLIRTKDSRDSDTNPETVTSTQHRLARCLSTMDLTSLGVGSCVGTGMYLVAGMVAKKYAGPGVVISFLIAALASLFSGACYAEFGVRVPNTTGSAYMYAYVTVGEFIAFIIGWNMILEYLIGTSACARALSACFDSLFDGAISKFMSAHCGTIFGKPPDFLAFFITLLMMFVLLGGVKKSLFFNNILNSLNLIAWVFIMGAGLFYVDLSNWTEHGGFLPFGWSGVFNGAATCFYAFIGFDIIATTGEEANNPKRSIPLSILFSLIIILMAYVTTSMMLTLIVPYNEIDTDSALVLMFTHVRAPVCKYVVAVGAVSGLTVSMFGSMFPMPRIIYAMARDGLIFKNLNTINPESGIPSRATLYGGIAAALVSLVVQLEVLVEMMSIGTLLAYSLVSSCVLVLRYQCNSNNLIELLPQSLRTPIDPEASNTARETAFLGQSQTQIVSATQRVMVRRVTRSSPDSDDTPPDEAEDYGQEDAFLINSNPENKFYGVPGGCGGGYSRCSRMLDAVRAKLRSMTYLCPSIFPWVDPGPATKESGLYVIKAVGVMYVLIILLDLLAAYGDISTSTFTAVLMFLLLFTIMMILLMISRKPQNRANLIFTTPGVPYVPAIAVAVNFYLILNLSILTLLRFTTWMTLGMIMYFKYGIKNSILEVIPSVLTAPSPPPSYNLDRASAPSHQDRGDRNIFEGDGDSRLFGSMDQYAENIVAWHESNLPVHNTCRNTSTNNTVFVESRFNARTNGTSSHMASRPPWAEPNNDFGCDFWKD